MKKITIKKSTLTTLITVGAIVLAYVLFTVLINVGAISNATQGYLVPICVYIMMAVSLNLVVGFLGELSLGHAGFLYVGAFAGGLVTNLTATSIPNGILRLVVGMVAGACIAAIFGMLIGTSVLRLRGDYLAIVTLAFGEVIKNILGTTYVALDSAGFHMAVTDSTPSSWSGEGMICKGAIGMAVKPLSTFTIGAVLVVITVLIAMNLSDSRTGRAIKSVRDNKIATETVGIKVSKYRLMTFVISAAIAGVAGVLYAHYLGTLQSSKFDFNFSINILVMVVLGGMGNIPGSVIAAIVLTILPEKIRFLGDFRMVIYAVILVVVMIFTWNPKMIEVRKKLVKIFMEKIGTPVKNFFLNLIIRKGAK